MELGSESDLALGSVTATDSAKVSGLASAWVSG
jgi:hypothetical protein